MTAIDKHAPGTVGWFDLMTSDADAARRFYGELFGWEFQVGGPDSGHYAMAQRGGKNIAGVGAKPPGAPYPTAWSVYFIVDDADLTCAGIREHGGTVAVGPMDVLDAGRMVVAVDPTGAVFGLWQPKQHAGAQLKEEPGTMAWCECNTRDADRACGFYQAVFDLTRKRLESPAMVYFTLHRGDVVVGGVNQIDDQLPPDVPSHWIAYFEVASADASSAKVTELGGTVIVPPFDTPYGRISVLQDPQGGHFSIVQPPAGSRA